MQHRLHQAQHILVVVEKTHVEETARRGGGWRSLQMVKPVWVDAIGDDLAFLLQARFHPAKGPMILQATVQSGGNEDHLVGLADDRTVQPPQMGHIPQKDVDVAVAHRHDIGNSITLFEAQGHGPVAEQVGGVCITNVRKVHLLAKVLDNDIYLVVEENTVQRPQNAGIDDASVRSFKGIPALQLRISNG